MRHHQELQGRVVACVGVSDAGLAELFELDVVAATIDCKGTVVSR